MKHPKIIGILVLAALPVLFFAGLASAQDFRSGDTATVGQGEVVTSTLWAGGKTIDIAGTVEGDVFCAGQNVSISGTIKGDVICAAQTINITGNVAGDVRAAAQTLNISAKVENNLTAAAQTVTLETEADIGQDASIAATDVVVHGAVGRDLSAAAQSATISGNIGRNVKANLDRMEVTNNARIDGHVEYTSPNEAQIEEGAVITGDTTRNEPSAQDSDDGMFGFMLLASISVLAAALALTALFPQAYHRISDHGLSSPVKTLAIGFIATLVVPALIFVLMLTLFGIPLALLALVAWVLVLALSTGFAAYAVGRLAWRGQTNPLLIMLAGGALLLAIRFIPILGVLVTIFAVWFGVGTILIELKNRYKKPNYSVKSLR